MREYLIIDGVDLSDFGVYLINSNSYSKKWLPKSKIYTDDLPYQNGVRFIDKKYDPKVLDFTLYFENTHERDFNRISKIFSKNKQQSIIVSTELQKEYTAVLNTEVNPDLFMNGAKFNVSYIAHNPFASSRFTTKDIVDNGLDYDLNYYYNSGLLYDENNDIDYSFASITSQLDFFIHNGSNTDGAKPNIILNGSADDLTITKYKTSDRLVEIGTLSYGAFSGELEINCKLLDTFLNGSVDNSTFDGNYFDFELDAGEILKIESGDDITISGQTIELPDSSSGADDYYNGYYISLINNKDNRVFYRIEDYNGSTKTLTLDSVIDATDLEYAIYDIQSGMNYFTIDGTNLNISEMVFDFRFIYV